MHDRKLNGCRQRLLFARHLIPRKCSLCSQGRFSPSLKMEPCNIVDKVKEVDKKLSKIKPPNDITRCPRKIETERQYWKAFEFRSFILFYGPIVLRSVLPEHYYRHFIFLSEAIFVLLGDSISC